MKHIALLFIVFLFAISLIHAQTDFREGYIIKNSGDTVYGLIDYRGDLLMGYKCKFKSDEKSETYEYSPDDIFGYRFPDSKFYISKSVSGKNMFLEYLIKGRVNIYYLRDDTGDHYYIEKDDSVVSEIPYTEKVVYKDGKSFLYQSHAHIGILNYYMQDAPGFKDKIEKIEKPEHDNLLKLAEDYHNKVCKDESCIIFEKKQKFKINVEAVGGIVNYENIDDLNDKYYFQGGAFAHYWVPGSSEKIYLKTGLFYTTMQKNNIDYAYLIVPLQIEYLYPRGIIRPKISYGLNIYLPLFQTVAFTGGLNIKLTKSLYWSVYYNIDCLPIDWLPMIPTGLFSQSVLTGLYIDF